MQAERIEEPGRVIGTNSKPVQYCMLRFHKKLICPDELTQAEWWGKADYMNETNLKYSTAELVLPVGAKLQTNNIVATPAVTTIGELLEALHTLPG